MQMTENLCDAWVEELEKFYPNTGDQVIAWRRDGARALFNRIYAKGVKVGRWEISEQIQKQHKAVTGYDGPIIFVEKP